RLDRTGRLFGEADPAAAADRLLARYRETGGLEQPARHRAVADHPRDADRLNARIQAARWRAGLLGLASVRVNPGCRVRSGDRVVFTRSSVAHRVRAGQGGTVTAVNPLLRTVRVRTDRGDLIAVPVGQFPHLRLGYADPLRALTAGAACLYALVRGPGFDRRAADVFLTVPGERAELFTDRTPGELAHLMARNDQGYVRVVGVPVLPHEPERHL
ncbi:MAG: hypothetical protein K2X87_03505, partial [Gemmataceae bacterium]|nr:hypothetical protein [Gemmataceae bacterium]